MTSDNQAITLCLAIVAGNVLLLIGLAVTPMPTPTSQITAGFLAMFLHGWCAWEIGQLLFALSKNARRDAFDAKVELLQLAGKGPVAKDRDETSNHNV